MPRNILLRVTGDNKDAKGVIDDTVKDLQKLREDVTAEIRVDAEEAKRQIDETKVKLATVPREETIHLRINAEQAKLDAFIAKLAALKAEAANTSVGGELPAGLTRNLASVSRQIEGSRARLDGMLADLERLGNEGDKDVGKLTRGFTTLAAGINRTRTTATDLTGTVIGKVPLIGGIFEKLTDKVGKLAGTLLPEAAEGASGLASSLLGLVTVGPVLLVIVAAVAALVVSLGQALIGVIALGAAFLVALGPIAALLGIVLIKIKDIVSGQIALKQASANLKTATDAQRQAVTQLHQAEVNEARQRIQALQAQRQAVLALADAENQTADAKLGVDQAKLNLAQARLTLAQFKRELAGLGQAPGDLLGKSENVSVEGNFGQTQAGASSFGFQQMLLQYKADLLAVKEAAQGVPDAVSRVNDAIENQADALRLVNQYKRDGLKADPDYLAATDELKTAYQNLKRADDQVASAELAKNTAIRHGAHEANGFISIWDRLKKALGVLFGPAEKAVFAGIEKAMGMLAKHPKALQAAFLDLGKAIGGAFVFWAKMIEKPGNLKLIVQLIHGAAGLTRTVSRWLGSALKFVIQVGTDAMPSLLRIIGHWASELSGINGKHKSIRDFIDKCIASATTWWHRLMAIGGAVIEVAGFFKTILGVINAILAPLEKIGQLLGIGKSGGILAGLAILLALKGGAGGGGILSALPGGGAGGILGKLGLVAGAGIAGYGIGSELYQHSGAVRSAGGAFASGVDSLLGIDSTNPNDYAKKEGFSNITAAIEKSLATGIEQIGPHAGRKLSAALEASLLAELKQQGINYTGPIHPTAATPNHTHHHHYPPGTDADHTAAVLERRLRGTGSGVN